MGLEWLRSLYGWLRRLFCRHVDVIEIVEDIGYSGVIICGEERTYTASKEVRRCQKCGRTESHYVGPARYVGWT